MTVEELVEFLQRVDPEATVIYSAYNGSVNAMYDMSAPRVVKKGRKCPYWDGESSTGAVTDKGITTTY